MSGLGLDLGGQTLLSRAPKIFAQNYGIHYVSEVVWGAAYLGYYNVDLNPGLNITYLDWFKELDVN